MEDREKILAGLRPFEGPALPSYEGFGIQYPDPVAKFFETVAAVSGTVFQVNKLSEAEKELPKALRMASTVPGLGEPNTDLSTISDPRQLSDLDLMIAAGAFGVAENGAIWVWGESVGHRAALFIAVNLVLVVRTGDILHNLHQAYDRLKFQGARWGAFISGPSKTADIEQALVVGAQGPKTLRVVLTP